MNQLILTRSRLPLLIALICCMEVSIYLWSVWTTTFEEQNFFAISPELVFDKCARVAARISTIIHLAILLMVGFYGLKKLYADNKRKDTFLILITLFTLNHLIHLLFVVLRFRSHGESISLSGPVAIGGTVHNAITFALIVVMPFILWKYQHVNGLLRFFLIIHLLNVSSFIIKTFLGKIAPPGYPAYHNQFGVFVVAAASFYIVYEYCVENKRNVRAEY